MTPDENIDSLRRSVSIVNALLTAGAPMVAARPSLQLMHSCTQRVLDLPDSVMLDAAESDLGMVVANAGRTVQVPDTVDALLNDDAAFDLPGDRALRLESDLARLTTSTELPTDVLTAVDVLMDFLQRRP